MIPISHPISFHLSASSPSPLLTRTLLRIRHHFSFYLSALYLSVFLSLTLTHAYAPPTLTPAPTRYHTSRPSIILRYLACALPPACDTSSLPRSPSLHPYLVHTYLHTLSAYGRIDTPPPVFRLEHGNPPRHLFIAVRHVPYRPLCMHYDRHDFSLGFLLITECKH